MNSQAINSIQDCKTDRQVEIFKSFQFEFYKYKNANFGQFQIWDGGLNFNITTDNKNEIIERLKQHLDNSDVCHCQIYSYDKRIAKCYDRFMHCWLDSNIFVFTTKQKEKYADNDIDIYFDNES